MKTPRHDKAFSLPTRRDWLRSGLLGTAGLLLGSGLPRPTPALGAVPADVPSVGGTAKALIQIWMWGGPSHLDTFDPKPEAGSDYCGPLTKPISTNVDGLRIGELLPELAKQADKYSVIRGMTHGTNAHETATYLVQTGRMPGEILYPSVGSVVSYFKGYRDGYEGLIPPYVVLTKPQGRFSEEGFLGLKYKAFATGGDPAKNPFAVEGLVAQGISRRRQEERRDLLRSLDRLTAALPEHPALVKLRQCEDEAYDLILGEGAAVFDLAREPDAMRDRYGRNTFGQSCLAARRLVESGVPVVTINYQGWDTHKNHFNSMRQKLPRMDQALAALLGDLSERGLLDSTVVWWSGEFGRTPKIQWEAPYNGGRGHWGSVFSAVVAGGGFQGGQVVGSSDARGEEVRDRPVSPCDLIGSIYNRLGIDGRAKLPHPMGTDVRALPSPDDGVPMHGQLAEIMV